MSVLIKGMEMPSGCLSCDFCNPFVDEPYCRRLMRKTPKVTRLEDCPLVPVPSHGRLIDSDALEQDAQKRLLLCNKNDNQFQKPYEIMRAIACAPIIIEAEEGE